VPFLRLVRISSVWLIFWHRGAQFTTLRRIRQTPLVAHPSADEIRSYCTHVQGLHPRPSRLHGQSTGIRGERLREVEDVEARQRLRSSSSASLIVSRTRLPTVGDRALLVAAARVWNSLPNLVTSAPSVAVFRSRLKTHLFNLPFSPVIVQCLRSD